MSSIQCSVFSSSPRRLRSSASNFFSSASMSKIGSDPLPLPITLPVVDIFSLSSEGGLRGLNANDAALRRLSTEFDDGAAFAQLRDRRALGRFVRAKTFAELFELRFDRGVA